MSLAFATLSRPVITLSGLVALLASVLPVNATSLNAEVSNSLGKQAAGFSDSGYLLADRDDDDDDEEEDKDDDDDKGGRYDRKRERYREWHKKGGKRRKCFDSTTVYETRNWRSSMTVTRLVNTNSMVVYFDVLEKPVTRYANAVYTLYAWKNDRWEQIYVNTGARLISKQAGRFTLQPEVIDLDKLKLEGIDLATTRIKSLVQVRYDTAERRDRRLSFSEIWDYRSITQVTNIQEVVNISNSIFTTVLNQSWSSNQSTNTSSNQSTNTSSNTSSNQSNNTSSNQTGRSILLSNGFRITYLGVSYSERRSTWRYRVEETYQSRDLSNWVLGLPGCVRVSSANPGGELVNPDPNARISGIKWQTGSSFRQGEFSIILDGQYTLGTVTVAAKGPDVARGSLPGPSCGI